jgi:xanthine/CO dehydrogenase XdhC/CoxF family maturation factor
MMSALVTRRSTGTVEDLATPGAAPLLHLLSPEGAAAKQHILAVTFRSADGRRWDAVGGGESIAAAIEWARECCPEYTVWEAERWNNLYGD